MFISTHNIINLPLSTPITNKLLFHFLFFSSEEFDDLLAKCRRDAEMTNGQVALAKYIRKRCKKIVVFF